MAKQDSNKKPANTQDRLNRVKTFAFAKNLIAFLHKNGQFDRMPTDQELKKAWKEVEGQKSAATKSKK